MGDFSLPYEKYIRGGPQHLSRPDPGRGRDVITDDQGLTLCHYRLETKGTHGALELAVNQVRIDRSRGDT